MADLLRKGAAWLGLVTDDRYAYDDRDRAYAEDDEYVDDADYESTEMVHLDEHEPTNVTQLSQRRGATAQGRPQQRPEPEPEPEKSVADLSKIVTVNPRTYNEARTIGEHYRDKIPVIMNLSDMDDADAKRLVDFAAGLVFGLRGTIERVTSKVFLLSPQNVSVAAEDKERIAGGFYNQS